MRSPYIKGRSMRTLIAILTLRALSAMNWGNVDSLRAEANIATAAGKA